MEQKIFWHKKLKLIYKENLIKKVSITTTRVHEQLTKMKGSKDTSKYFHFLFVQMPHFIKTEGRQLIDKLKQNKIKWNEMKENAIKQDKIN